MPTDQIPIVTPAQAIAADLLHCNASSDDPGDVEQQERDGALSRDDRFAQE